jgi:hypothetical protein
VASGKGIRQSVVCRFGKVINAYSLWKME